MSDQPSLTDEMSMPCPHGVDLNYFVCPECGNTPSQTIPVQARTWTRSFTDAEQNVVTNALLNYRRLIIVMDDGDTTIVDGILRDGWVQS